MTVCPDCGQDHHPEVVEAAAEVEAAEVIAEGAEGAAHEEGRAEVEVARVGAERDVELARIDAKVQQGWQEARVAELEGRLSGMSEVLDRLVNPPAPEPAPAPAAPVEMTEDEPPAPEESTKPAPEPKKKSKGWF